MTEKHSILVAHNKKNMRIKLCRLLNKKGYITYQATDSASVLRIARSYHPSLILIDMELKGMYPLRVGKIIESNHISSVIYMVKTTDHTFINAIQKMNIYAYLKKPFSTSQLYQTIEFSLINLQKINYLKDKVSALEKNLEDRKIIAKAKGIIIKNQMITEEEAYKYLRQKSMDECISIKELSERIIEKNLKK